MIDSRDTRRERHEENTKDKNTSSRVLYSRLTDKEKQGDMTLKVSLKACPSSSMTSNAPDKSVSDHIH